MVSQSGSPPIPMPVQVPPGHVMQQIVDESGALRHVILSTAQHQGGVQHHIHGHYVSWFLLMFNFISCVKLSSSQANLSIWRTYILAWTVCSPTYERLTQFIIFLDYFFLRSDFIRNEANTFSWIITSRPRAFVELYACYSYGL